MDQSKFRLKYAVLVILGVCSLCLNPTYANHPTDSYMSTEEFTWRLVSTAMLCPMLLEFIIDEVVWFLYPALRTTAKEDPINHFIVMMSLLPTSLAISWVLQDVAIFIRLVLLGVAKAMTVYGLLGKANISTYSCT